MLYSLVTLLLLAAPILTTTQMQATENSALNHRNVTTDDLKAWYDQKKDMVIIDARSKAYFDGTMLPNGKWLPSDSSEDAIRAALPNKDVIIVIYCAGPKCPASGWLYDKLQNMGYRNVYEYHGGLEEWTQKGYPTTTQNQ